jgi:hypothetical protein
MIGSTAVVLGSTVVVLNRTTGIPYGSPDTFLITLGLSTLGLILLVSGALWSADRWGAKGGLGFMLLLALALIGAGLALRFWS